MKVWELMRDLGTMPAGHDVWVASSEEDTYDELHWVVLHNDENEVVLTGSGLRSRANIEGTL